MLAMTVVGVGMWGLGSCRSVSGCAGALRPAACPITVTVTRVHVGGVTGGLIQIEATVESPTLNQIYLTSLVKIRCADLHAGANVLSPPRERGTSVMENSLFFNDSKY